MDDVLKEVKADLEYEGLDTQFLDQLKTLWEEKLKESNVTTGDRHPVSAMDYHMLQLQNRQNTGYSVNRANLSNQKPIAPTNTGMISINRANVPRPQIISAQPVTSQNLSNRPILITQSSSIPISNQNTNSTVLNLQTSHPQQTQANFSQNQITSIGGQNLQVLQINNLPYIIPSNVIMTRPNRPHVQQSTLHMQQSLSNVQQLNQAQILQSSFQPPQNSNRIPKSQVDGKDSDFDEDDYYDNQNSIKPQTNQSLMHEDYDDRVDIMSEAPSSVRGPMSNLPPLTRNIKNPTSNVNDDSDDDADLVSTSNTPLHNISFSDKTLKSSDIKRENVRKISSGNRHSDSEFEDDLCDDFSGKPASRIDTSDVHDDYFDNTKRKLENSSNLDEVDEEGVLINLPKSSDDPSPMPGRSKSKKRKTESGAGDEKDSSLDRMDINDKLSDTIDIENDDDDDDDDDEDEDEEPLNSQDDVSDEDADVIFEADNLIVCQYDKIHRSRNKWRLHFKDGIMSIKGRDYLFQKATGEAEW